MYKQCCVSSCTSKQDTVLLHKIPRNSDRQRLWLDILYNRKLDNLTDSQYWGLKVCEKHFERRFKTRWRLRCAAYPTLFTPEEISKGVPDRTSNNDTCLLDHTYTKNKEHNDHTYIKVDRSGPSGTKNSNIPGTDRGGGTVSHDAPVADDDPNDYPEHVAEGAPEDAAERAPVDAAELFAEDAAVVSPENVVDVTYENLPKEAAQVASESAPRDAANKAPGLAPEDSDLPDLESRKLTEAVFSWEAKELIIEADDTDVPESHQEVSAPAVLDRDLTETSLYQEDDPYMSEDNSGYDHSYGCDECGGTITGFRYTCVQCADWDLCGACEARAAHAAHYVLRIPSARPYKEIQAVLATIRTHLLSENHFEPERAHSVKSEPVELQELQEPQEPQELQELPLAEPLLEGDPLGDWEVEFLDTSDIEEAPEVVEDGAPPAKRRRPSPRAATRNTINPTMPDSPCPDCSEPILQRLPIETNKRQILDKTTSELFQPVSSQCEDKLAPPRTDPSPETIKLPAPPAGANIKSIKKILVRIPAGIDPAEVVKMLNPPVAVRL